MNNWIAEITNDSNNEYNLIIEILKDDEYIGRIYKKNEELALHIYERKNGVTIPVKWLQKIFEDAEKDL